METLIIYTLSLLSIVFIVIFGIKWFKKQENKQLIMGVISVTGVFIVFTVSLTLSLEKIVDNTKIEIEVPNTFYSLQEDSLSNEITAEELYSYLKIMRVPHPEIITAQAVLESANFTSVLYKKQNNFIGMKIPRNRISTPGQGKGEYKDYNSWRECVVDYIFWMHHFKADELNKEEYYKLLGKIYAEDPDYVNKLKKLIETFNFNKN